MTTERKSYPLAQRLLRAAAVDVVNALARPLNALLCKLDPAPFVDKLTPRCTERTCIHHAARDDQ